MINMKIGLDGIPNPPKLLLGNKYENEDEIIVFDLPDDFENFNKYIIGILFDKKTQTKRTVVLPVLNNQFIVSSQLTYFDGIWELYLMAREKTLDLSKTPVDITHDENERVFISNPIRGIVNRSSIEREEIDNLPLDSNIKIVYDDLMSLIQEVETARNNREFDGISPTVRIEEHIGERTITITDRDGDHSTVVKDYIKSPAHEALTNEAKAAAQAAKQSETKARQSEGATSLSATKAKEQADLSQSYATQAEASKTAASLSEQHAKASETIIEKNKQSTTQSEANALQYKQDASQSALNASQSETNVSDMKQAVEQSQADVAAKLSSATLQAQNAATSASNAKKSEDNVKNTVSNLATKTEVATKLDKNLGAINKGKLIYVDNNGMVTVLSTHLVSDLVSKEDISLITNRLSNVENILNELEQETFVVE